MKFGTFTAANLPGRRHRAACCALSVLASSITALCTATPAAAALTHYANEASWRAAAGATTTIAVPNIPQGVTSIPQLGLSGAGAGGVPIPPFLVGPWNLPAGTTIWQAGINEVWSSEWTFTQPIVTAFALDWLFNPYIQPGFLGASVYLGTTHVGSVFWQPATQIPGPPVFYGFTSSQPFNRVVITAAGTSWGRAVMFSQIPAPGAIAVLGLAALATRRRRRA
jgi:hypothetical protein